MSLPIISPRMSALRVVAIRPRSPIRSFVTLLVACPLESGATALTLARFYMSPPASLNRDWLLAQEAYRLLLFTAASSSCGREAHDSKRHPFFRSYGVNWPSSLTTVSSITLGFSPHLPESVCGTDTCKTHYVAFLGSVESGTLFVFRRSHSDLGDNCTADLPTVHPYILGPR
jgi:hypothetical protein